MDVGDSRLELTAPMVATLMAVAVDGGVSDGGVAAATAVDENSDAMLSAAMASSTDGGVGTVNDYKAYVAMEPFLSQEDHASYNFSFLNLSMHCVRYPWEWESRGSCK